MAWSSRLPSADAAELHRMARGPDFDLDGYADFAVHAWDAPVGSPAGGQVLLLWGGPFGPGIDESRGAVLWQNGPGVADATSSGDMFGWSMTWGDFDGDCYSDLVLGVPGENIDIYEAAGAVHIFYGGENGFSPESDVVMHRGWPGMEGELAEHARFGHSVEAGDFDGDRYEDLAIGTRNDVGGAALAGDVHIVYGSASGLDPDAGPGDQIVDAGTTGLTAPVAYGYFGSLIASGDFDCDGDDDLAIEGRAGAGGTSDVHVLHGSDNGLYGRDGQLWEASSRGLDGIDWFTSTSLAVGNFDGTFADEPSLYIRYGCMDLAIGLPYVENTGAMVVLYGHPHDSATPGLTLDHATPWYFDHWTGDIPPPHGTQDAASFGTELTVAQLDTNMTHTSALHDDLVVSTSEGVVVLRGTPAGLTDVDSVRWTRETPGIPGTLAGGDHHFGDRVGFGDYDGDGDGDLAITAPYHHATVVPGAGNDVTVLELDADASPVIESIESWMAVDYPDQLAEPDELLGTAATEGRTVWPDFLCPAALVPPRPPE